MSGNGTPAAPKAIPERRAGPRRVELGRRSWERGHAEVVSEGYRELYNRIARQHDQEIDQLHERVRELERARWRTDWIERVLIFLAGALVSGGVYLAFRSLGAALTP